MSLSIIIFRLEDQNKRLLSDVTNKDEEVAALQDDVTQLTGRINEMNIEHNQKIGECFYM